MRILKVATMARLFNIWFLVPFLWLTLVTDMRADVAEIVARFPQPSKINADYPDDAERYATFTILNDFLYNTTRGPHYDLAYALNQQYFKGFGAIEFKYSRQAQHTPEGTNFWSRAGKLMYDASFKQAVLNKYHIADLPEVAAPTASGPSPEMVRESVRQDTIKKMKFLATVVGWPLVLVTFVAMYLMARPMVKNTATQMTTTPGPAHRAGDLTPLPDSLRTVAVPGMKYVVEAYSGLILNKETTVQTQVHTTTTPGEVHTVGGQVYTTPGQTSRSVTTTQTDTLWLRLPDGKEVTWRFVNTPFKMMKDQIISILAMQTKRGDLNFLLGYNHNTDELQRLGFAHGARIGGGWIVATCVGTIGFGIALRFLSLDPDSVLYQIFMALRGPWTFVAGAVLAAVAAVFVAMFARNSVVSERNAVFIKRYLPGFKKHFEQCTAPLRRIFRASPPKVPPPLQR